MWLFKRKRGDTESRKWYCEVKDHLDIVRRIPLLTDTPAFPGASIPPHAVLLGKSDSTIGTGISRNLASGGCCHGDA